MVQYKKSHSNTSKPKRKQDLFGPRKLKPQTKRSCGRKNKKKDSQITHTYTHIYTHICIYIYIYILSAQTGVVAIGLIFLIWNSDLQNKVVELTVLSLKKSVLIDKRLKYCWSLAGTVILVIKNINWLKDVK